MNSTYLLGNAVNLLKFRASVAALIYLLKTFIWNTIVFTVSNLLNLLEFVVNELNKSISQYFLPKFLFLFDLSLLNVKIPGAYN